MGPKKIKKRPKQNLSYGSGSSSESDGCKGTITHRRSERLGKQVAAKCSPVIDCAYDGDGETTEESVSDGSDQVMRSVGSDAYDFEDDTAPSTQALSLYPQKPHRRNSTAKRKPDKNSSQEKPEAKVKQKHPKANKSSVSTVKKANFSVASILKTKFDNKIVEVDSKSCDHFHSDSSLKSPPLCTKENAFTGRKSPVSYNHKTVIPPGNKTLAPTDNTRVTSINRNTPVTSTDKNTPVIASSKKPSNKKTPVSCVKNGPALSTNKKTSKSSVKKNTPVLPSNKNSSKSAVTRKTPVVSFSNQALVASIDRSTPVTSASTRSTAFCTRSHTPVHCHTTTKRKAAGSSEPGVSRSPRQYNDSGVFVSPPPLKVSKLGVNETSTPSNVGGEPVTDACFGFTDLQRAGSPMLSPVQRAGGTPTSDYCSAILSLSEISMQDDLADLKRVTQHDSDNHDAADLKRVTQHDSDNHDSADLKRVTQHSVFSGDDLEPDIAVNKVSSKSYKSSNKKRAKGRYSSSKVEAWAEKVNQEFEELDNFELSIEG